MAVAIVTGSAGLIGSEAARLFSSNGFDVLGIDNDLRKHFFGPDASTRRSRLALERDLTNYTHCDIDIRDQAGIESLFEKYGREIQVVIHTAAQPSHDWAARDPQTDFAVNAAGTLNLLEGVRHHCPDAVFLFTSTNKVYGDSPNRLPMVEMESRWEVEPSHPFAEHGIDETMSIDQTTHSLFGVSKLAADALVQEYGRYFHLRTGCFRGGCLTGPGHSGAMLHGFLSYLVRCSVRGEVYRVLGYKGKQVRDNLHAADLAAMFWQFFENPRPGEVYNVGGGRDCNCSVREAITMCEEIAGRRMSVDYVADHRLGDHIWYISDVRKFKRHYPKWSQSYNLREIVTEIAERVRDPQSSPAKRA